MWLPATVINILQNICLYVQQKKETHTGLEQLEAEQIMTELSFCVKYAFESYYIKSSPKCIM